MTQVRDTRETMSQEEEQQQEEADKIEDREVERADVSGGGVGYLEKQ